MWDLVFYVAVGAVVGGRLGYVIFYNAPYYFSQPIEIFSVWTGGMSFHGGLIGVICAIVLFARRFEKSFFLRLLIFSRPFVPLVFLRAELVTLLIKSYGVVSRRCLGGLFFR